MIYAFFLRIGVCLATAFVYTLLRHLLDIKKYVRYML